MKKKRIIRALLVFAAGMFLSSARSIDVAPIGPNGTDVGFSTLNKAVFDAVGVHWGWYALTQALGYLALGVAGAFALFGLWQLLRRRSLRQVDRNLLWLGGLYLSVIALYVIFELVPVNYRPILMPGKTEPEPSFPSSHTLLICTVMLSAAHQLKYYVRKGSLRRTLQGVCCGLAVLTVCGRLLSGVHWFTDILGGLLYSAALLYLFVTETEADRRKTA